MAGEVFVDTNILVYSRDTSEPGKHRQARAWMAHLWARAVDAHRRVGDYAFSPPESVNNH
jgi:hypothetical protein